MCNESKGRQVIRRCLASTGASERHPLHLRLGNVMDDGVESLKARGPEFLSHHRDAVSVKSQQYGYQNKTYIMTTLIVMPTWMGGFHKVSPLIKSY